MVNGFWDLLFLQSSYFSTVVVRIWFLSPLNCFFQLFMFSY